MEKEKNFENKETFAERHPRINAIIGLCILLAGIFLAFVLIRIIILQIGQGIVQIINFLKKIVSTADKVIIVAMITGSVSIIGVVISSVIAKIIDYRYNVKKYLYDKREKPYEQFIDMVYQIIEDIKQEDKDMSEQEIGKLVSEFSKGLTLWGSNRVVKKWLKYRKASIGQVNPEILLLLEDIIYEMRKDVGQRKKLAQGSMLSFFINDVEVLLKK